MLVWGGHREPVFGFLGDGGSFAPCPCADPETWYPDSDGDGFGDPLADVLLACGPAPGRAGNGLDCDDGHASVHPGAPQECGDELNNDCASPGWPLLDGTNEQDDDGDGLSECGGDCSDADSEVHPGAAEQCQGRDDDCDGFVDEGLPPGIVSVGFSPGQLWPPNHRMVEVTAKVDLTGGCTATCAGPSIRLDSITSSELDDTAGSEDGQTEDDIREANLGTTDFDFELRAERSGEGDGRLYRIRYAVTDCAGQQVDGEGGVFVPHDRAGVVEPLDLAFLDSDGDGSVVLSWNQMDRAIAYNVIMGRLKDVQAVGSWTVLHDTQCLLRRTSATSVPWPELVAAPAPGDAFFYLVEYFDGGYSGYGTASGERETVILSGDSCR
jgi:hypothetical protein